MKTLLQISAFLLISHLGFAQNNERKLVLEMLAHQTKNWNDGNIPAFMEDYEKSDSLMFIGKSGVVYGWKATLEKYKKNYPDKATMGTLKFDILKTDFTGKNACWILGKFHLTRPEVGDANGIFTLLLKKKSGNWQIVADHTTGF